MAITNPVKLIEFTARAFIGEKAYITFDGGEYLLVTLVNGDPRFSIEISKTPGTFVECEREDV